MKKDFFITCVVAAMGLASYCNAQQSQESNINHSSYPDVGIVSQNISLYCTAAGLGTVACAPRIDSEAVQAALGLPSTMIPLLYHPIAWPAE